MRLHVVHAGPGADRPLDPLGYLMRRTELQVRRELQVQGDARRALLLEDDDVVGLLDERLGKSDRKDPVAQVQTRAARLDVDHDVAPGQHALDRALHQVRGAVPLDHRLPGRDAHDHVSEVAAGRLAQPQPADLDVLAEAGYRPLGRPPSPMSASGPSGCLRSR